MKNSPKLFVEIPNNLGGSSVRKASSSEIKGSNALRQKVKHIRGQIERLESQIKRLESKCDHQVIFDTPGWEFDCRACFGCGKFKGLI